MTNTPIIANRKKSNKKSGGPTLARRKTQSNSRRQTPYENIIRLPEQNVKQKKRAPEQPETRYKEKR